MLWKILSVYFIIIPFFVGAQSSFIKDPDFEMGVPSIESCRFYSTYHFKIANTGWSVKSGSPDLITKDYNNCVDNQFLLFSREIKSQCLGIYVSYYVDSERQEQPSDESVFTQLLQPLNPSEEYYFGFRFIENQLNFGMANFKEAPFVLILFSDTQKTADTIQLDLHFSGTSAWDKAFTYFQPSLEYDHIAIVSNPAFFLLDNMEEHRFYYLIDDVVLAPAVEVEEIKPTPVSIADSFQLYFDHNQFLLGIEQKGALKTFLNSQSPLNYDSIVIVGHADTVGTYEYNYRLSLQRAQAIKEVARAQWGNSISITVKARSFSEFDTVGVDDLARRSDVYFYKNLGAVLPWYRVSSRINQSSQWMYLGKVEEGLAAKGIRESFRVSDIEKTLTEQQIDAKGLISRRAQDVRVLIINENHHDPYHRFFIAELLEDLHNHGYRHIAVEELYDQEKLFTNFKDPIFLDYLRKAIEVGFNLHSFNINIDTLPDVELDIQQVEGEITYAEGSEDFSDRMNKRAYYQYLRIKEVLKNLSEEDKLIIHVRHGHGKTRQSGEWKPLGAWLKEDLGDQLLSIDQATLNECVYPDQNDYNKHYNNQKSIVPYTNTGPYVRKEFNLLTFRNEEFYDLSVLHSFERKRNLRTLLSKEISFSIKDFEAECPCLVLVYYAKDDPLHATAFSIQEINESSQNITAIIPKHEPSRLIIKCVNDRVIHDSYFE